MRLFSLIKNKLFYKKILTKYEFVIILYLTKNIGGENAKGLLRN